MKKGTLYVMIFYIFSGFIPDSLTNTLYIYSVYCKMNNMDTKLFAVLVMQRHSFCNKHN